MRVVVDANVVAGALVRPGGWTAQQLDRDGMQWLAPSFVHADLEPHLDDLAERAQCALDVLADRFRALIDGFRLIDPPELAAVDDDIAVEIMDRVDPADVPYMATLLATGADAIWTRDRALLDAFPGLCVMVVPDERPMLEIYPDDPS